ncbi:MAG: sensor histidine kinase [Alcaligenaceae bacterium]|nr:sensor histidine kinase [Alcaligenaceae bacterium]
MSFLSSLRSRLLVGTVIWVIVALVLAGWGLQSLFKHHVIHQQADNLQIHLNQLIALVTLDEKDNPQVFQDLTDPRFNAPLSGLYWQIDRIGQDRKIMAEGRLRSRSLWDTVLPTEMHVSRDEADLQAVNGPDNVPLFAVRRMILLSSQNEVPLQITMAVEQKIVLEPIAQFTKILIIALFMLAAGLITAVCLQLYLGLRPFERLRKGLANIHEGKTARIEGNYPAEVQLLVSDFNAVLSLNEKGVERARTQASNLAHAIKTPLTIITNAARHEPSELAVLVKEQVKTALHQVNYHLNRTHGKGAGSIGGARVNIADVVNGLLRVMQRLYAEKNISFDTAHLPDDIFFMGDERDLHEMVGNVIDNACKWTASRVLVSASSHGGFTEIVVEDNGRGLSADEYERIFRRGVRTDENTPGSGLGLDIVRELVTAYGGQVRAEPSALGGLKVCITFFASHSPQRPGA